MEDEWVPQMMEVLGIDRTRLPIIWDADFLSGPRTASGEDTYVLCEINVSSCFAIPPLRSSIAARCSRTPRWCCWVRRPGNVGEGTARGARRPRCPHPATRLLPIGSLLAEGLWAAGLCCAGFKVPGDLVVVLRNATKQGF
jgi:hypothetical protein